MDSLTFQTSKNAGCVPEKLKNWIFVGITNLKRFSINFENYRGMPSDSSFARR